MPELRDIYDANRKRTGRIALRGHRIRKGDYALVVHVILFNRKQQMLIQRRNDNRPSWPGLWDVSCGGSVLRDETSRRAALRELKEELGIKVDLKATPQLSIAWDRGFDDVYCARLPEDFKLEQLKLQADEVAEARFAGRQEILELIRKGEFLPYREAYINLLFAMQDQYSMILPKNKRKRLRDKALAAATAEAEAAARVKNSIVLVEPEIHANTGNISRTCVVTGTALHLVKPLGFSLDDKHLKRAGLDYWPDLDLTIWESLDDFKQYMEKQAAAGVRILYGTTKGAFRLDEQNLRSDESVMIVCGKETAGLPEPFLAEHPERCVRLPMGKNYRSLNLSNAAAIMIYECLRQQGWPGLY